MESMGIRNIVLEESLDIDGLDVKRIFAQFKNEDGQLVGTPLDLPHDITPESLATLCNVVLESVRSHNIHLNQYPSIPYCISGR